VGFVRNVGAGRGIVRRRERDMRLVELTVDELVFGGMRWVEVRVGGESRDYRDVRMANTMVARVEHHATRCLLSTSHLCVCSTIPNTVVAIATPC
jgi:hypothetical protein